MKHLDLRFDRRRRHRHAQSPGSAQCLQRRVIAELTAVFAELARARRSALHRAGRQRHGLLRRRRPELDEAHGGLHARREPGRRRGRWPRCCASLYRCPKPTIARVQGDVVCRRHGPGRGLRHRGGGRHGAQFCLSEVQAGPDPGHHQPLRDPRHGRARRASLLPHGRALRRGRGAAHRLRARGGGGTANSTRKVAEHRAGAGAGRPGRGEGLQAADAGRGGPQDHARR